MLQFQGLMNHFLETQQQVMLAYLHGSRNGVSPSKEVSSGTTPDSALFQAMEGGTLPSPALIPPTEESLSTGVQSLTENTNVDGSRPILSIDQISQNLVEMISERTGYPPDMFDLDANLEADLGIDSIKRVEILGAFLHAHSS
jgi:hypothetical protein